MSKREITAEDLTKVKRMGATKADAVLKLVKGTPNAKALTVEDFSGIQGVSESMAEELVKLVSNPDAYESQPPTPRKRKTAKKATKKATAKKATARKTSASTNGRGDVKAGTVRKFAREADAIGLHDLANTMRANVSSLLDDEKVNGPLV